MIRKIFLFVWCLCIFSLTKATNLYSSKVLLSASLKDSSNSIKFFPSLEVYYDFFGSIPFTSVNFEPTILEYNNYFINLRLSHSYWYGGSDNYFFQTSLLAGIKLYPSFNIYGGFSYKLSRYTILNLLRNKMGTDLFANIGLEYITKFNMFIKIGFNKQLFRFKSITHAPYNFPFNTWEPNETPNVPFSIGVGYLIFKSKSNYLKKLFYFPKNTLSLTYGFQYPQLLLGIERILFNKGNHALLINTGFRYGKYRHKYPNYTLKSDMKNIQLGLDYRITIIPHISWFLGFSDGYYYVVDNDKSSYFNELITRTGVCFLIGNHFQIKYFINFPFYYFDIHPNTRTKYYLLGKNYVSNPKISIGYSFGYKKH